MTFGERLAAYRAEQELNEEELAARLGVSRQLLLRWESGAAVPEPALLPELSKILGVLPPEPSLPEGMGRITGGDLLEGLVISREDRDAFLAWEKRRQSQRALGAALLPASGIPMFLLAGLGTVGLLLSFLCFVAAVGFLVYTTLQRNPFKRYRREPLVMDRGVLGELRDSYRERRKQYIRLILAGLGLLALSVLTALVGDGLFRFYPGLTSALCCGMVSGAVFCFIFAPGMMGAYEVLVNNREYREKRDRREE